MINRWYSLGLPVIAGIGYLHGTITVGETAIIALLGMILSIITSEKRIQEEET